MRRRSFCNAYNGPTFWASAHCGQYNALIKRMQSVADAPSELQVQQAQGARNRATTAPQADCFERGQYCARPINERRSIEARYSTGSGSRPRSSILTSNARWPSTLPCVQIIARCSKYRQRALPRQLKGQQRWCRQAGQTCSGRSSRRGNRKQVRGAKPRRAAHQRDIDQMPVGREPVHRGPARRDTRVQHLQGRGQATALERSGHKVRGCIHEIWPQRSAQRCCSLLLVGRKPSSL